jgi:hypothetical protein
MGLLSTHKMVIVWIKPSIFGRYIFVSHTYEEILAARHNTISRGNTREIDKRTVDRT